MNTGSPVRDKSFAFAIRIVQICQKLVRNNKEYVLSKQLLKSGTSIGANIEEAVAGQSKRDFLAKMSIAYKEARETQYWIRLMTETGYLGSGEAQRLSADIEELCRIIGRIKISTKENLE